MIFLLEYFFLIRNIYLFFQYYKFGGQYALISVGCIAAYTLFTLSITQWRWDDTKGYQDIYDSNDNKKYPEILMSIFSLFTNFNFRNSTYSYFCKTNKFSMFSRKSGALALVFFLKSHHNVLLVCAPFSCDITIDGIILTCSCMFLIYLLHLSVNVSCQKHI